MFKKSGNSCSEIRRKSKKSTESSESTGKNLWNKMKVTMAVCMIFAVACLAFTGCMKEQKEPKKVKDLEFTVVGEQDTPKALQTMILEKKSREFKLTYADGQDMYIVIGKGEQAGGGYSIAVKELYLTENSVVIRTELMGPKKGEAAGTEPSYPVLIVKTEFYEEPVVFQ